MKLCTFQLRQDPHAPPRPGAVLEGGDVVDLMMASAAVLGRANPPFDSLLAMLASGPSAMDEVRGLIEQIEPGSPLVLRADLVRLLAPIPRPTSLRDCMCFEQHLVQATRTVVKWRAAWLAKLDRWAETWRGRSLFRPPKVWFERPIYYKGNPHSVVGPDADVRWPSYTEKFDFELEFGAFIGQEGRDIPEAQAMEHVAGFAIFNDFSARDVQLQEMQGRLGPAKGKDFDTGNAIGPYLVTPDEVGDPHALRMTARVNGELWSDSHSSEMHFRFEEIIAYVSRDETLQVGDFIGAGTAPNGCGLELDRWLRDGDIVELEVEKLGVLRNRVVRTSTT